MSQKRHKARKAKRRAGHMKWTAPTAERDTRRAEAPDLYALSRAGRRGDYDG